VTLSLYPIEGVGRILPGHDLGACLVAAIRSSQNALIDRDVVVVCQKVVSKAEGRVVDLATVAPGERAAKFAADYGKDAALIELALRESGEILRMTNGHLITSTGPGFVCANAGIDRSNQERPGEVTLLPLDADASAARLRATLRAAFGVSVAVVVSDTFGRPWRLGQVDFAIGAAGMEVLDDHAGRPDLTGRVLEHTVVAVADQIATAAGLLMGKAAGVPAVIVRGARFREGSGRASELVRPRDEDLFR
jgi:coenzyme F420-0:L-glutamate ligase/coenzyme F420-1:gamma-L-glutamate ligase